MSPIDFYKIKLEECSVILIDLKKKLVWNSIFRLISFLLIFVSLFAIVSINVSISVILTALFLILFLWLVRIHLSLQKQKRYYTNYERIVSGEIEALNYNFENFNCGEKYINHKHGYSYDLDLFGKGSVFSLLNRTITQSGEQLLAKCLIDDEVDQTIIAKAQKSVKELSQRAEFLLHFRATGMCSEIIEEEKEKLAVWCKSEVSLTNKKILRLLVYVLPSIASLALIGSIIGIVDISAFILLFLLNLGIVGLNLRTITKEHNQISRFLKIFEKYRELLNVIEHEKFASENLSDLHKKLFSENDNAATALTQLTKLTGAFDNRLNLIAALFLEGFLLYDYHCLFALENWRHKYGTSLTLWLEQVAKMDSYISMATFAFNNPTFNYPLISSDTILKSTMQGHPLIHNTVRVCNDFALETKGEFIIVTGANMAGKSTFLRTIGVNLLLAKVGLPVCANYFEFKPVKVFTSMRTSDSLSENESYFYAELKRLKEMFSILEKGEEVFIILDEILKGTNSVDKQKGSYLALEKILHLKGTGIIATHDLALTKIVEKYPEYIKNKCFEIEIDNAKISFDYKVYEGVTQKMNALLLMEQMGII